MPQGLKTQTQNNKKNLINHKWATFSNNSKNSTIKK